MSVDKEESDVISQQVNGKRTFGAKIRGYILAGIMVTAPISITLYLTYAFLLFIDSRVKGVMSSLKINHDTLAYTIPGIGILIAILFFIIVGWFATNFLGKLLYKAAEYIVHKMPGVRAIYGAIKQIVETVLATQSQAFRKVVLIEYPRKGIWSLGFLTGTTKGEVQTNVNSETVNVFVPTTPNPTSGFLLFFPKKDVVELDMSVEEGIKMVVSAGIITPPKKSDKKIQTISS